MATVFLSRFHGALAVLLSTLLLAAALPAAAAVDTRPPHEVVEQTTTRLLAVIDAGRGYYDSDRQRFHKEVQAVLDPVVDFDAFARGVMGRYASAQRYQALPTQAEKDAFRAQIDRFRDTFKSALVQTYAGSLLKFGGGRIETLEPRNADNERGSVGVVQHIYGQPGQPPFVVQYTLRKNKDGSWKVRNVMIEGINLGQTYRNQFAAAAEASKGNIDQVIDNWKVQPSVEKRQEGQR